MRRSLTLFIFLSALMACRGVSGPAPGSAEHAAATRAFYVGLAALQVGDDVRAEAKLKEFNALAPNEPAGWADLGLLYLRQREFERAAEQLEKARALAPESAHVFVLSGLLESSRGSTAEALTHLRHAVELEPRNLKALYALASEIEREWGEAREDETVRLLEQILSVAPDNLAVQLDLARLAAKRGDATRLRDFIGRLEPKAAAWPPEVREQFASLQAAASSEDVRAAATRVQFLRNVLVRLPEYRQARLAVQDPPEVLGEPFTRPLRMETPAPRHAPPDTALTFQPARPEGTWDAGLTWGGTVFLDGDGPPTFVFTNGREVRLSGGAVLKLPETWPPAPRSVAALDFDYDFKSDLAFASEGGFRLYRQEGGSFVDVTERTTLPNSMKNPWCLGVWPADIEADGDLDIVLGVSAKDGPPVVLRNNGDGTFTGQTPFGGLAGLGDFAWADFDGDGDPDAGLLDGDGRLGVFANERAGDFSPRAVPQGVGLAAALGVADLDDDGRFDLLVLQRDGALRRLSDAGEGRAWEVAEVLPAGGALVEEVGAGQARLTVADLDNNGRADLLVSTAKGTRAWLGDEGGRFAPLSLPAEVASARALSVADTDADGRLDLVGVTHGGEPFRAAGRGSKNYHWQVVRPRAANATGDQRINSFGVGGEMEIRAGLLTQKQLITGPLVHFGLGEQTQADVVRVVWPNGTVRAEFELKANQSILAEQRLKGSCPSLFAFDGRAMSFVKDCAPWSPAIGLRINSYQTARVTQTEEWVKIDGARIAPRGGFYDLAITAELWETYYLDRYELAVVDHPAGTEVFVDERTAKEAPALKVYAFETPRPFASARDSEGADVSEVVRARDGKHLDDFGRGTHQGVTRDHFVELEMPSDAPADEPLWLVAHGWLHPTDASINVALSQGAHAPPRGLSLEVFDGRGWVVAKPDVGFPAGKNKTILVDLNGVFREGAPRRLRLRTNMEIYWDALAWAREAGGDGVRVERLGAASAELRFRGFSEMRRGDGSSPETPDYHRLASTGQAWRDLSGYYTRFGDVRELLASVDDRYVIANAGDELLLRFPERPAAAHGHARDYVLVGNGWIKDGDYNSQFSKTVLPLPSRDREYYTTPPTRLEDDPVYRRFPEDWQNYHTRYVTPGRFIESLRVR